MDSYLATISAARQLTLPERLCQRLGIKRGDKVVATVGRGSIILTPMWAAAAAIE
jgi:bifunctional DNA-binding transcriptional regulator/antitoxin component of YhaV-PrlF toxin-antitoxin module